MVMAIGQRIIRLVLDLFGLIYISIEKYVTYPDDGEILGVSIDGDLHKMSRQQLCRYMDDEIEHYKYWMSSAPTIFGNSGGAVYRWSSNRKQYEYIGIPSRISIQPMGFSADAITHMGYFIPIDRVYQLLEENDYQFIYDNKFSIDDCKKARKEKQEPKEEKEDE